MRLEFDPRDANACASVIAMITGLHGSLPFDQAFADQSGGLPFGTSAGEEYAADEAFDAPAPEQAFAAQPVAEPAAVPLASAPAAATPPPPSPAPSPAAPSGVELDSTGLPWDARIHSGPADKKPKTSDGKWRAKRGASDNPDFVRQVEAELRQVMGAPAPAAAPPAAAAPAPVPQPPVAEPVAQQVAPPPPTEAAPPAVAVATPTAVPPAPPTTPAAADTASGAPAATTAASAPAAPAPTGNPFADLMRKITGLQTSGHLTVEGTKQIAESLGITGVRDLMHRPDLIPAFDSLLPVAA